MSRPVSHLALTAVDKTITITCDDRDNALGGNMSHNYRIEGPFKSRYNALAITALQEAENWLSRRTLDRMARGVEGQSKA